MSASRRLQHYEMGSRNSIADDTDAASETTSISRASSYQKLNGNLEQGEQNTSKPDDTRNPELNSLPGASFNFINSIIGAGVIGIPYALHQAGIGLGIILIISIAALTDYSIVLLIQGGNLANTKTYQGLVNTTFGKVGFLLLTAMQFLYPFIAMVGYNVVIGDSITAVIERIGGEAVHGTALASRQLIIVVTTVVIMLPLSLYRDVAKISKASLLSLLLVIFILFAMLVKAILLRDPELITDDAWDFAHPDFAQSIGILSFAYMCHHNSFLLYTSLENPTEQRWNLVTHIGVLTSMFITLLFGILGYITFTGHVQGDVLLNYCFEDDFMNVARFAYAMNIVLTWPLECFVTREVIENSIFATKEPQLGRHMIITVIIAALTCGISMATDCVEVVLQFNGVLAAIPLAFIFPPLCVLRLQQEPILSLKSIPKIAVALFGIISSILGFAMTLLRIAEGQVCGHMKTPAYCPSATESYTNFTDYYGNMTTGNYSMYGNTSTLS
ncbi:putative sodium-coupled neutral amino acid transporter 11 [Watersipora subatra]|uniref:putative sodium-coupled neutral amino acid transporter 11 n=1 Tax=Watersipora subatra TaxID=2589382 RepID=UPI00355C8156